MHTKIKNILKEMDEKERLEKEKPVPINKDLLIRTLESNMNDYSYDTQQIIKRLKSRHTLKKAS